MSYGHPCKRITAGPLLGPASMQPIFKTPASICLRGPSAVPVIAVCPTVLMFYLCGPTLTQRSKCGAHLLAEDLRLLPGCEVTALAGFVEINEVWVDLLGPAARR